MEKSELIDLIKIPAVSVMKEKKILASIIIAESIRILYTDNMITCYSDLVMGNNPMAVEADKNYTGETIYNEKTKVLYRTYPSLEEGISNYITLNEKDKFDKIKEIYDYNEALAKLSAKFYDTEELKTYIEAYRLYELDNAEESYRNALSYNGNDSQAKDGLRQVLTKKELIDLNQILLQDIDSCKFGILIAMTTGIRLGELCSLKWKNINLTDGYFVVNKTMQRVKTFADSGPKTKVIEVAPKSDTSNRQIPIPENLLSLFKKFQTDDDCYVLTGRSDEFMEPRRLEHRFKKYTRLAGIEKAHFHMLRHTFATFCIESGFELKSLSEVLGHSGSQVTLDRYVHSSFQLKKTSMNNFSNNFISGQ